MNEKEKGIKKLFRIYGLVMWIDRNDEKNFIKINEYVWAINKRRAENRVRFRIANFLMNQLAINFLPRISLEFCSIEQVKINSEKKKNQLNLLFKKFIKIKKPRS